MTKELHWTFDTVTGVHTGWLHPEGPQHVYLDSLGDRYVITINGTYDYTVQKVCFRAAGTRLGQFDNLTEAREAAQDHANQEAQ